MPLRRGQHDEWPCPGRTLAEGIIQHECIEGDPRERFTERWHDHIQEGMIRVMLDEHEQNLIEMIQPIYQGHTGGVYSSLKLY